LFPKILRLKLPGSVTIGTQVSTLVLHLATSIPFPCDLIWYDDSRTFSLAFAVVSHFYLTSKPVYNAHVIFILLVCYMRNTECIQTHPALSLFNQYAFINSEAVHPTCYLMSQLCFLY